MRAYVYAVAGLILMGTMLAGCSSPIPAQDGDTVKMHYTGRLEDGSVFDSSQGTDPLEFTIGEGTVIAGFEQAAIGMAIGETKTVTIPASEAYGQSRPDLIVNIPRSEFPDSLTLEPGQKLNMQHMSGQTITVNIVDVAADSVTIDANHPLAGKTLIFDLELVEIIR